MKKCYLFLSMPLFFALHAQSQVVQKGDRLFGGSFSLSFLNNNASGPGYNNAGNAGLMPSFAWGIKENLVLGVKGNISYTRSANAGAAAGKTISSTLSVGPGIFLKKYKSLKDRFGVCFNNELNVFYAVVKQEDLIFPDGATSNAWGGNYNFNPGVFFRFSESFIGEANIGGVYLSYYKSNSTNNWGFGASFLQNFTVGVNYVLGKKK